MAEIDRLISVGQAEMRTHELEAQRLHDMADELVTSAEWHLRQSQRWSKYVGSLVVGETVEIPTQRHLFVVK